MSIRCGSALMISVLLTACSHEVKVEPDHVAKGDEVPMSAASLLRPNQLHSLPQREADWTSSGSLPPGHSQQQVREAPSSAGAILSSVLYSEQDAEVGARMDGVVTTIVVELGDPIRAGQLLAVLADEEEEAAIETARAVFDLMRLEHARAVQLREQNLTSQADLDQATYRLRAAQAALRESEVRLSYTRVLAPFDGVVSRRLIRAGQSVTRAEPLFRVTALSPLRAQLRVPEVDARALARGQPLRFRGPGGEEVSGSIARVAPAVDPASGTVEVLVSIPNPGTLRPGSAVTVTLDGLP